MRGFMEDAFCARAHTHTHTHTHTHFNPPQCDCVHTLTHRAHPPALLIRVAEQGNELTMPPPDETHVSPHESNSCKVDITSAKDELPDSTGAAPVLSAAQTIPSAKTAATAKTAAAAACRVSALASKVIKAGYLGVIIPPNEPQCDEHGTTENFRWVQWNVGARAVLVGSWSVLV